jgi:hypothetical protein
MTYWQPLSGLVLGSVFIVLYFILFASRNKTIVPWIAKHIFRNENMTPSAESLFRVVISYLFMFGGIIVILALLYLTH